MKGVGHNIAREAVLRHKEFKSEIYSYCGQVDIIEARNDCVLFVSSTEIQRDKLLAIETVVNKNVLGYETTGSASDETETVVEGSH